MQVIIGVYLFYDLEQFFHWCITEKKEIAFILFTRDSF